MIGHLEGTVFSVGPDTAIIDVAGVGYEVNAVPRTLDRLTPGQAASLAIDTMVRQDFIRLYAFADETERQCFRLLQSVQGVGAKASLAILQVLTPGALLDAISIEDHAAIARAQGVGKKIATRIVSELAGKAPELMAVVSGHIGLAGTLVPGPHENEPASGGDVGAKADAVSALVNLGYDSVIARQAVGRMAGNDPAAGLEDLITAALKELSQL